ncbi:MAG: hypothetical protein HUU55_00820 [Myxococcales bacterium]|nr:hypothetical protein [Myxococcales bacterium]
MNPSSYVDRLRDVPLMFDVGGEFQVDLSWVGRVVDHLSRLHRIPDELQTTGITCPPSDEPSFSRFVTATLAADWASYPNESDQVDVMRLSRVLSYYPTGFCTYFTEIDEVSLPVGYYGFYPVSNTLHEQLTQGHVPTVVRQTLFPYVGQPHTGLYYVFNYSVAPAFVGTPLTRRLLSDLDAALKRVSPVALCAMTVSAGGERVARRFGMHPIGTITSGDKAETLFFGKVPQISSHK